MLGGHLLTFQTTKFLEAAIAEAEKCTPVPTAFCVGCVLVVPTPGNPDKQVILATGYSRELPGNTHAEANAIEKARNLSKTQLVDLLGVQNPPSIDDLLTTADVYTTMEPCSIRTSGLSPCANLLIDTHVKRCMIGTGEPLDFVQCEGAQKLTDSGIEVIYIEGYAERCLQVARKGRE